MFYLCLLFLFEMQVDQGKGLLVLCWYCTISRNFTQLCLESKQRMLSTTFGFYFRCNMLQYFDWLCLSHPFPCYLVIAKWLLGCNFSLGIFIPSVYSWNGLTWTTIRYNIDWLVVFPSNYGKYISCDGATSHSTTIEFICFFFVMVQLPSQFSLTVPEAPILLIAKNFRR